MTAIEMHKDTPVLFFATQEEWRRWLHANHDKLPGVWVKVAKKASGITSISREEALDVALCYGWIDAIVNPLDETYFLQKYTKRRPKGTWSKRNIGKVERFTAAGLMQPSGQAEIDAAKADGRWDQAYDSPTTMTMPEDFKAELEKNPDAKAFYGTLNKTNVYPILWRIQTAKTPKTRQARMSKLIDMLNRGEKLH